MPAGGASGGNAGGVGNAGNNSGTSGAGAGSRGGGRMGGYGGGGRFDALQQQQLNGGMTEEQIRALIAQMSQPTAEPGQLQYPGSDVEDSWIPGANEATSIYNKGLAPLDPNNYLANTMAELDAANPYAAQIGAFDPSNPGIAGYDAFAPGDTNPYADRMFDISADRIQDQINSQFGAAGQGSSSGNLAEQISRLGDYGAKFYGGIYDADMNRALDATHGRVGAYQNQNQLGLDALGLGAGTHQSNVNAAASFLPGIQQQIQDEPYSNLKQYTDIVSRLTGTSPQEPDRAKSSGWDKLIGLGGIAASVLSDRRAKENIVAVGRHTPTGLNVYHFNYLDDPRRFEGFMADEVEQARPDAVTVGPDGFSRVFYDRLGFQAREIH